MKRPFVALRLQNPVKLGCAAFFLCAFAAVSLPAQSLTTLFSFDGTNGEFPSAPLVEAVDGNFYGTTYRGGSGESVGTVFKISPGGALTTIYSLCPQYPCTGGELPNTGLVQSLGGSFYGATDTTAFKITPAGAFTALHVFCSEAGCADGAVPNSLVQATNGDFYGTTFQGGTHRYGTVFSLTAAGTLTTIYDFCSLAECADGQYPAGSVIQAPDGNFYGVTRGGTIQSAGTVYKVTASGTLTTLYSFCSVGHCADGYNPYSALLQGWDGDFYGITSGGGAGRGGTVFRITPGGILTTLHSFCVQKNCADGSLGSGLIQATDGNLYGTASNGGAAGGGTVYKLTPEGAFTTLYNFCSQSGCADGGNPVGLIQATDGAFYGVTDEGGSFGSLCPSVLPGCGTVFSLSVGLGPFVETRLTSGRVGGGVEILGNNLLGASSVRFNGTPAVFKVLSTSLIAATVPAGASTGTVEVVTNGDTLSSNVPFHVLP